MKTMKSVLLLGCVMFSLFYGCSKDSSPANSGDTETATSVDNSFAESTNDDITTVSTQSEDNGVIGSVHDSTSGYHLGHCATITRDMVSIPHTITIYFGDKNCLCYDGKYRRGKIIVSYNGGYRDSGSTHSITLENYYVNDYHVEGSQTVKNLGHDSAGFLNFSVQINSKITDTTGKIFTYTSTRTREWVAGENTSGIFGWLDDVYKVTINSSGTNFNDASFTSKTTKPLQISLSCPWIEAGTIAFTPSGKLTRTIDYGNGDCDNQASVSIAGVSFPITLR